MKICFITSTIFNLGGVQRVLSVLANELSKNHEVDILCTDSTFRIDRKLYNLNSSVNVKINSELVRKKFINKILGKVLREINCLTGIFNDKDILTYMYYPNEIQKKIMEYLNLYNYDVVIGCEGYYSLLVGIISNKLKAKTIGWQHSSYHAYLENKRRYYWNQNQLFKEYIPKLDKCIVLTKEDSRLYKEKLNVNCDVIYNPLSFHSEVKSKCNNKSIIFVGRLVEAKGIDLLIEAFSIVHQKKNDWILKIVGDGPDRKKVIKYIDKYNLKDNVILVGMSDDVKQHYIESSIFVSSSRWEGFGLAITEAMECGLPVISFANSGPREIINQNNINGILLKNNDVYKLAEVIIDLIENKEKRIKISKESLKRASDFKLDRIVDKWNEILKDEI
ncbi:glycosyltransferase family 4 protein [Clostridium beijerinckii]|uniref:glycosyltransferase family 4 protein n=1 Tax=Clostridium beijerinckii TaxID=1520 RepID=UPI0015709141|nr:glycosyltransferase family 4 protein [Clostridium beijerinckii]NRT70245.1 glycosyltransferase involved in cell wall biosynthesis [Clostridium beijerinckii]